MAMSIGQNFQPFSDNGDVSTWVKKSRVGEKNKETIKQIYFYWMLKNKSQISKVGFVRKPISIKMRREKNLKAL